ncbi:MAG: efflux RND transporter permease subunit, partial [Planctomycetota bacterium]
MKDAASSDPPPDGPLGKVALAFFRDTRLLVLVLALITVSGLSSLALLPRMEDPVLRSRVALVVTRLPGADAKRVETLVTEKIEQEIREIDEIKEVRSVSRVGISTVSIELRDSILDTDTVWSKVRSRVEDAIPQLPSQATRPVFDELNVRAYALIAGVAWDRPEPADLRLLRRLATDLQDKIQNLAGTEVVDRFGDPGEEVEVRVDPVKAASLGLTPVDIARRLAAYDAKGTAGQLRDQPTQLPIELRNQLDAVAEVSDIPIAADQGRDVRLREVSDVTCGVPNPVPRAALMDGRDAVVLGVMVRNAWRIDQWTTDAQSLLDDFSKTLPTGVVLDRIMVQNDYVEKRLSELTGNLLLGAFAVALVIFVMMGWRSAIIVTMTLPLASLMVLMALRMVGIPIHQMSVTGLIIAFGLLIDNAIVVVDEVKARLRQGDAAGTAMARSVTHLAVPLLGSTLTTAFAFAPIALMPGPGGEFVGAIGVSVIFAIISSLFLALTVIPTVAARFLASSNLVHSDGARGAAKLVVDGLHTPWLGKPYERFVRLCLHRPWIGIATGVIVPIVGFFAATTLREQFFPPCDRNQFHVTVELPATRSIARTQSTALEIDR